MELEIKVLLNEEEYYNCLETLHKDEYKTERREDTYYSQYESMEEGKNAGEPSIRISKSFYGEDGTPGGSKSFFTIKRKKVVNETEINEEYETEASDISVIEMFLKANRYKSIFTKKKEKCGGYIDVDEGAFELHAEAECINEKVYALEIEYTGPISNSENEGNGITKKRVLEAEKLTLATVFGINPERIDGRSWKEILGE